MAKTCRTLSTMLVAGALGALAWQVFSGRKHRLAPAELQRWEGEGGAVDDGEPALGREAGGAAPTQAVGSTPDAWRFPHS